MEGRTVGISVVDVSMGNVCLKNSGGRFYI